MGWYIGKQYLHMLLRKLKLTRLIFDRFLSSSNDDHMFCFKPWIQLFFHNSRTNISDTPYTPVVTTHKFVSQYLLYLGYVDLLILKSQETSHPSTIYLIFVPCFLDAS